MLEALNNDIALKALNYDVKRSAEPFERVDATVPAGHDDPELHVI